MKRGFGILVASALLLGCSGSSASATRSTSAPPEATPTPMSFPMQGLNDGAGRVTGLTTIVAVPGSFSVTLRLTGLPSGSNHVAHIHRGSCAVNGSIVLALSPVLADSAGNGISTTAFSQDFRVPAEGWYANVHTGPDLSTPQNALALACADLRNP